MSRLLATFLLACLLARSQGKWEMQYFHDEDKTSAMFVDLAFMTPERGVAAGVLTEGTRRKGLMLVTLDGGSKWAEVPIKEIPVSLFFLNESTGWMVTDQGLWFTEESGRSWKKLKGEAGLTRVHFVDRDHGWAIGLEKKFLESTDGGKSWKKVADIAKVQLDAKFTSFDAIDFSTPKIGLVLGRHRPPRRQRWRGPIWADPNPESRAEWPSMTVTLDTADGGQTWSPRAASIFGRISQFRVRKDGVGLALVQFENYFSFASEVFVLDLTKGSNTRVLRRKDRAITDIDILPGGGGFAAGYEPQGSLAQSPIPGKLRVMFSPDLTNWIDMPADYRAVARHVVVSAVDAGHAWVATDMGMILRWNPAK